MAEYVKDMLRPKIELFELGKKINGTSVKVLPELLKWSKHLVSLTSKKSFKDEFEIIQHLQEVEMTQKILRNIFERMEKK